MDTSDTDEYYDRYTPEIKMDTRKYFFQSFCVLSIFIFSGEAFSKAKLSTELAPIIEESQYCKELVNKETQCKPIVEYWDQVESALRVYTKLLKATPTRRAIGSDSAASATRTGENSKDVSEDDIEQIADAVTTIVISDGRIARRAFGGKDERAAQNGTRVPEPAHVKDRDHACNDIRFDFEVCAGVLNNALKKRGFKGFGETDTLRRTGHDYTTYDTTKWLTLEEKVSRNLRRRESDQKGRAHDLNLRKIPPTGWAR